MKSKFVRFAGGFLGALTLAVVTVSAQPQPAPLTVPPPVPVAPAPPQPNPLDLLQWDSVMKELTPVADQPTADFVFSVTNNSEQDVVIDRVQTSCGCTVAKLPSQPWVLVPHTNGQLSVTVNLAGKSGTLWKTITVYSTNAQKVLTVKVNLPENAQVLRMRNQQMASNDPQMIFKGECAKCHVDKSKGLMGKALYKEACGICHEAEHRASLVPDLRVLNHPTDYGFWKQIIAEGKPKTMMPGFSVKNGGPLSDEQVESLAKVLTEAFPSGGSPQLLPPTPTKTSASAFPLQTIRRIPPPPTVH